MVGPTYLTCWILHQTQIRPHQPFGILLEKYIYAAIHHSHAKQAAVILSLFVPSLSMASGSLGPKSGQLQSATSKTRFFLALRIAALIPILSVSATDIVVQVGLDDHVGFFSLSSHNPAHRLPISGNSARLTSPPTSAIPLCSTSCQ
jgi:hypothetical protein